MAQHAEILVAHSYYLRTDPKQLQRMRPYSPLGPLIALGVLRQQGYSAAFFDAMLAAGVDAFEAQLDAVQPKVVGILEDNFNFLTKMCTLAMREQTLDMIRRACARGCKVAVNGSDATDRPKLYLDAGAHAVLLGEPEHSFAELSRTWLQNPDADLSSIAGLMRRDQDGVPRQNATVLSTRDLDLLPLPAWDAVDIDAYRKAWTAAHGRFSWNMVTSRGCPYGCNWCAKPIFGRRYAQRSPASAAQELALLREHVAPDHVWFADDIFGLTAEWIGDFAIEVHKRNARTPFMIQTRANLLRPAAVKALADSGAEEVWIGVESGSQKILDAMDKGTRVEEVRSATRVLRAHGIRACWFLQLGYSGETWDDLLLTRDLLRTERPDDIGVSVAYPLPGTKFYENVRAQLGIKHNWSDTGDLAMLFRGTYDTAFYRRIRDLLHDEVRSGPVDDTIWAELAAEESIA